MVVPETAPDRRSASLAFPSVPMSWCITAFPSSGAWCVLEFPASAGASGFRFLGLRLRGGGLCIGCRWPGSMLPAHRREVLMPPREDCRRFPLTRG